MHGAEQSMLYHLALVAAPGTLCAGSPRSAWDLLDRCFIPLYAAVTTRPVLGNILSAARARMFLRDLNSLHALEANVSTRRFRRGAEVVTFRLPGRYFLQSAIVHIQRA